jgi:hypothetical protein
MTASDPSKFGERILQNEELVELILESAEHCSAPMTLSEFRDWLRTSSHDGEPAEETRKGEVKQ